MKQKKTFKQKLAKVPQPIKHIIELCTPDDVKETVEHLGQCFLWSYNYFIPCCEFWHGVFCEMENVNTMFDYDKES